MNFEIETGTGSSTATSYASVANYTSYWLDRGETIVDADASIQAWLNIATEYIDNAYTFTGNVATQDQALEWPRYGVYDKFGKEIVSNTVPSSLIKAVCYLAKQAKSNDLNKVNTGLKSINYGPVSKTFSSNSSETAYPYIDTLLKYYLVYGNKLQRVN